MADGEKGLAVVTCASSGIGYELEIVDLNCRSTVHLAKLALPAMVARNEGRVLFTSSIAATMPGSFQAVR